ncbi:hypothetical protein [Porphyromonas endodontalis]|uniref:hypothetical protein n=1 Tax=Porphyromonas endodontalis TaxID=28124 RepID=UPI003C7605F7
MTRKLFPATLLVVLAFLLAACGKIPSPKPAPILVTLPSSLFGKSYDALEAEAKQLGQIVTKDAEARTLTVKINGDQGLARTIYLQFDAEGKYRYAMEKIANTESEGAFVASLLSQGFVQEKTATKLATEGVFVHKQRGWVVFISHRSDSDISYVFAPFDEAITSWSRIDKKEHATGLWAPLMGLDNTLDMVTRFEARMGHTLDPEATMADKGVFSFKTGNPDFPSTRYWFDVKTKSFVEECAIFVAPGKRPKPDDVTEYMRSMGFLITTLSDHGNPVYYNKDTNMAAVAELNRPTDGSAFVSKVQFFKGNPQMADSFMKEELDIPMPILEFGKYTLAEALELYKKQPYFKSLAKNELGDVVNTTSKDFPMMLIWEGEGEYAGTYAMAIVFTDDVRVINSTYIEKFFTGKGWEKYSKSAIPTYIDRKNNVMVQVDQSGNFGGLCLAFSPNEF